METPGQRWMDGYCKQVKALQGLFNHRVGLGSADELRIVLSKYPICSIIQGVPKLLNMILRVKIRKKCLYT